MKNSVKIVIWIVLAYILFLCVRHQYEPLPEFSEHFQGSSDSATQSDKAPANLPPNLTEILKPYEKTHPKLWKETHQKLQQALLALQKSIYLSNHSHTYVNNGGRLIDIAKECMDEALVRYQAMRGFHECQPQLVESKSQFELVIEAHLRKAKNAWNQYVDTHPSHLVSYQSTDGVQAFNADF